MEKENTKKKAGIKVRPDDPKFLVCKGEFTKEEKEHLLQIGHIYENEDGEILDVSTLTESDFAEDLDLSCASLHEVPAEQQNFRSQPVENKENSFDASSLELNMLFPPTPVTNNLGPRRSNRVTKKPFADLNNSSVCASPFGLQRLYEETNNGHKEIHFDQSEQEKVVVDESIKVAEPSQDAVDESLFISSPDVTMNSTFDKEANKRDLEEIKTAAENNDKSNDRPVENENTFSFNASAFELNTFFPPTPVTADKILRRSLRLAQKPFSGLNTSIVSASPMGLQRLFEETGSNDKDKAYADPNACFATPKKSQVEKEMLESPVSTGLIVNDIKDPKKNDSDVTDVGNSSVLSQSDVSEEIKDPLDESLFVSTQVVTMNKIFEEADVGIEKVTDDTPRENDTFNASTFELHTLFPPTPATTVNLGPRRSHRIAKKSFTDLNNTICASPYGLQRLYGETNKDQKEIDVEQTEQEKVVVDKGHVVETESAVSEEIKDALDESLLVSTKDVTINKTFEKDDVKDMIEEIQITDDMPMKNEDTFNASTYELHTFFPPTPVSVSKSVKTPKKPFIGLNNSIASASPFGLHCLYEEANDDEKENITPKQLDTSSRFPDENLSSDKSGIEDLSDVTQNVSLSIFEVSMATKDQEEVAECQNVLPAVTPKKLYTSFRFPDENLSSDKSGIEDLSDATQNVSLSIFEVSMATKEQEEVAECQNVLPAVTPKKLHITSTRSSDDNLSSDKSDLKNLSDVIQNVVVSATASTIEKYCLESKVDELDQENLNVADKEDLIEATEPALDLSNSVDTDEEEFKDSDESSFIKEVTLNKTFDKDDPDQMDQFDDTFEAISRIMELPDEEETNEDFEKSEDSSVSKNHSETIVPETPERLPLEVRKNTPLAKAKTPLSSTHVPFGKRVTELKGRRSVVSPKPVVILPKRVQPETIKNQPSPQTFKVPTPRPVKLTNVLSTPVSNMRTPQRRSLTGILSKVDSGLRSSPGLSLGLNSPVANYIHSTAAPSPFQRNPGIKAQSTGKMWPVPMDNSKAIPISRISNIPRPSLVSQSTSISAKRNSVSSGGVMSVSKYNSRVGTTPTRTDFSGEQKFKQHTYSAGHVRPQNELSFDRKHSKENFKAQRHTGLRDSGNASIVQNAPVAAKFLPSRSTNGNN